MAKVNFTAGRLAAFSCPVGKLQAFLWDSSAPGLALRVTANGARAFIFQSRLTDGQTVRLTIGEPKGNTGGTWTIPRAQEEARRFQVLIDQGRDPRREKRAQEASDKAARDAERVVKRRMEVTGLMAWTDYCKARKPHWSERSHADHLAFSAAGGEKRKRAEGNTDAGPLHSLLAKPLAAIDGAAVHSWVTRETKKRAARTALGFRLLRAFLNWCADQDEYRALVHAGACKSKKTREILATSKPKTDALQKQQLAAWFDAVRSDPNPVPAAFLQCLLLTGARREEMAALRWEDVDKVGQSMTIGDKVEGSRVIPLTPYVAHLIGQLPKRAKNPFVFTSALSASGRLEEPRPNHARALQIAELPHLTLHGLRRSFGTLAEWVEVPVGVIAQIQGHKPSAIAEKHYRARPIDLLRMWHERIEQWMLKEAGIDFKPKVESKPALKVINAA